MSSLVAIRTELHSIPVSTNTSYMSDVRRQTSFGEKSINLPNLSRGVEYNLNKLLFKKIK
jgi:hypothetical protein